MDSERIVRISAPAKINLGLQVLGKRADGFHDIKTIFVALEWSDLLEFRPSDTLEMTCSDPRLPKNERNLCMAAASLMAKTYGIEAGALIHLEKSIPYGAGLGGGSSDAAATLHGLGLLWGLSVSDDELTEMAAILGSDVPFFLNPRPSLGMGRGERLNVLADVSLPPFAVVVVPDVHISTTDAYAEVTPDCSGRPDLLTLITSGDAGNWKGKLGNDFEASIFSTYPEFEGIKARMYDSGAVYASMSGSGSAVYGLFPDEHAASRAASLETQRSGFRSWFGRMLQ